MSLNKTAMAFALSAMVILTGCSSTDEKHLDIQQESQAGGIDASTSAYHGKDVTALNNKAGDAIENGDKVFASGSPGEKNKQANIDTIDNSSSKQTIYFLYDSSEVEPVFIPLIQKQSQDLVDNPDHTLVLEGHADERGSREYNIALGEERAKAVAKMMQAHGVRTNQLEIVSYGEEKPSSSEHNETAWHLNRRVNLIFPRTQK
jgi:peptidoglycan-associated lipoprotein